MLGVRDSAQKARTVMLPDADVVEMKAQFGGRRGEAGTMSLELVLLVPVLVLMTVFVLGGPRRSGGVDCGPGRGGGGHRGGFVL